MFEMIDALEPRRLLAALDPNFGDHGATIFRFEISDAYYVAAQADGKALVGLYFFPGSRFGKEGFSYAVGRTNADGSIDQSFGGPDGSTFADIRTTPREEARILAVMDQANKPLALAFDNGDVNLLRFRSDGTLDPKFANGGRILFKSGQFPIEYGKIRVLSDGRIEAIAVGRRKIAVIRCSANGAPDSSLAPDGTALIDLTAPQLNAANEQFDVADHNAAIDSDGSIAYVTDTRVFRFTPALQLDQTFSSDGMADDLTAAKRQLNSALFEADHKLVVGGGTIVRRIGSQDYFMPLVARFNINGAIDQSFASHGIYQINQELNTGVRSMAAAPNGDIVVIASAQRVYRFSSDGALRDSYKPSGFDVNPPLGSAYDVDVDSQNRILIAGPQRPGGSVARIVDEFVGASPRSELRVVGTNRDDELVVTLTGKGADRQIVVSRNGKHSRFMAGLVKGVLIEAGDGADRIFVGDGILATVHGGNGDDRADGGTGPQVFYGDSGNDKIFAGAGDDVVYGGGGKDYIFGEDGNDHLYGGPDKDTIDGGANDDRIFGQAGDDVLLGGTGNDRFDPGAGRDFVNAGAGDDVVFAAEGEADLLFGGPGTDRAQVDKRVDEFHDIEAVL